VAPSLFTVRPTNYRNERGARSVVCKVALDRYCCVFYCSKAEQSGTGHEEFDGLENCVLALLQVQSARERQLSNISSGAIAADFKVDGSLCPMVIQASFACFT